MTDGEQRAALASVRSLGRAGHAVHVASSRARSLAGASRHCASETTLADPLREPDLFADQLQRLCDRVQADVLLPVSEPSLIAALPHRRRFSCAIPFPALDTFMAVCDKALVLRTAAAHGIAAPRQLLVMAPDDTSQPLSNLTFPVVIKPSRSVVGAAGNRRKTGVLYAADRDELTRTLLGLSPDAYPILLQERIEGPGHAISLLIWEGVVRGAFAHRRLREKPPSGGVSVLREGIPLDVPLLKKSVELLRAFAWQGVAMVEFKLESRTGTPYLMEINGRLWGSLQLAVDSGVDFPLLLVRSAMGLSTEPSLMYPSGVRTRWELGDLDHLLARLRHSSEALHLPPGAPGRVATIAAFVRSFGPGTRREILRRDDPRPFLRELADWLARR